MIGNRGKSKDHMQKCGGKIVLQVEGSIWRKQADSGDVSQATVRNELAGGWE